VPVQDPGTLLSPTALLLIVLGVLAVGVVVALVLVARRRPQRVSSLEERLEEYSAREEPVTLEEIELSASFTERVVYPAFDAVGRFVGRFTPAQAQERTRHRLELAGNPGNLTPSTFLVVRFVAMFVLGGLILGLMLIAQASVIRRVVFAVIVTILGFYLPVLWLSSQITRRQTKIVKQLPDTLDLLTICVEAGLGLDQAIQRVVEKQDNELSEGFGRYLHETRLGKSRREAFESMAYRMEVPDVTTFVAAVIQATDLGVTMARILHVQADQMRVRRRQRAEQEAHRAPIKIVFPLVFLIFPSILIVLLGPSLLTLMEAGILGSLF
jgi:tight adherence protein C